MSSTCQLRAHTPPACTARSTTNIIWSEDRRNRIDDSYQVPSRLPLPGNQNFGRASFSLESLNSAGLLTEQRMRSAAGWPRARDALRRGRLTFRGVALPMGACWERVRGGGGATPRDTRRALTELAHSPAVRSHPAQRRRRRAACGGLCQLPRSGLPSWKVLDRLALCIVNYEESQIWHKQVNHEVLPRRVVVVNRERVLMNDYG